MNGKITKLLDTYYLILFIWKGVFFRAERRRQDKKAKGKSLQCPIYEALGNLCMWEKYFTMIG